MFMRKMRIEVQMHKKETKPKKLITFLLEELFHAWMDNNADVQKFLQLLMMMAYIALRQNAGNIRYNYSHCKISSAKYSLIIPAPTIKGWLSEVRFVHAVTAGGSVKFLPAV